MTQAEDELDPTVLLLQAGHARYRAVELRALGAATAARENATNVAAAIDAAGAPRIDGHLPDNPIDAAAVLETRAKRLEQRAANELAQPHR